MKRVIKNLPILGLALAASVAFAFNQPNNEAKFIPVPNGWMDISHLEEGEDYRCLSTGDCVYDAPNGNVIRNGTFTLIE
ncbi:hypothetical protein KI659_18255 [Litoribacter alkaliphilus]|uniref:Secreted protein n=1 Tax=Litoribacter ruber TaxID=702568 RepID=A0AAP2CLF4_9BACT|nr:hypothetical protein [Litoribacter alkaliphilus]MBS9525969.1 hypothetical protein [Litoribacter alkaliphilus]